MPAHIGLAGFDVMVTEGVTVAFTVIVVVIESAHAPSKATKRIM